MMPIIQTTELVVAAAGLLILLCVPAVFASLDDRRARRAAVMMRAATGGADSASVGESGVATVTADGAATDGPVLAADARGEGAPTADDVVPE